MDKNTGTASTFPEESGLEKYGTGTTNDIYGPEFHDPITRVEKGEIVAAEPRRLDDQDQDLQTLYEEQFPIDENAPIETQFTVRAVLVGCILGGVIAASK